MDRFDTIQDYESNDSFKQDFRICANTLFSMASLANLSKAYYFAT